MPTVEAALMHLRDLAQHGLAYHHNSNGCPFRALRGQQGCCVLRHSNP